ncbi:MAG: hypothetical protein AAGA80_24040 [Cyanobacteria bacterium P01_F01_bin.143]
MTSDFDLWLTVDINNAYPDLNSAQIDKLTADLVREMRSLDEIDRVQRVPDPNPPEGEMSGGGNLIGVVASKLSLSNVRYVGGYVARKFASKPIDMKVKVNGKEKEFDFKGVRPEDLDKVVAAAERLAKIK